MSLVSEVPAVRWAFKFGGWLPTEQEWMKGLQSIQAEEVERISKFCFQKDAKSSLVGRLMLRNTVFNELKVPWKEIRFARTDRGKPYLTNQVAGAESFSMNVSHHGDFTVLAASANQQVGIDVMKTEWPRANQTIEEFFRIMKRQFTEKEWSNILQPDDEWDQLLMFNRHWCLKESYVKAVGVGLGLDLQNIDFRVLSDLAVDTYVKDTKVLIDSCDATGWRFEETMLDSQHCVATAVQTRVIEEDENYRNIPTFKVLNMVDLLQNAQPLGHVIPAESYANFSSLKDQPGRGS